MNHENTRGQCTETFLKKVRKQIRPALRRGAGAAPGRFTLAEEGWAAYVDPLECRMEEVLARNRGNPDAEEAAQAERREFAMFRENLGYFGYEFYLLRLQRLGVTGGAGLSR